MPRMSKMVEDGLEWYKEVLEENSSYLMTTLQLNSPFFAAMVSKRFFRHQEVEDIDDEPIKSDRLWKLVKLLQKKSSRHFSAFLDILRESGQKHIASKLAAEMKYKAKHNDSERYAQENINKYIHTNLGKSTHISITDQRRFTSELILQTDYQYITSDNKKLLKEIEELNDDLKEEKRDHDMTKDCLNDMIKQYKMQLNDTDEVRKQMEQYKDELKKSVEKIKELQAEKTALQEELDRTKENMEETIPKVEQSDGSIEEMKEKHQKEVTKRSQDFEKMQEVIQRQEKELRAMNTKVYAIMKDVPAVQSDSCDVDEVENMSCLECLDHILARLHSAQSADQSTKQKVSKEKRHELLKQLDDMARSLQEKEEQRHKELEEAKAKEIAMAKSISNYKRDIQQLRKKVEELKTPSPETRGRSDSLTSLNLPQVDMLQRSFMVPQQLQNPKKPMRRQASNDTILSLPTFHRPMHSLVTSHSLPFASLSYRDQPLQCQFCDKRINRTELIKGTCNHHVGQFNVLQQRWQCCQQPRRHPGCKVDKHLLKK